MKIKTYHDNRTTEEATGRQDWPQGKQFRLLSAKELKQRQERIKPEPPHHVFDIQIKPGTPAKIGGIPAAEVEFVKTLFVHYWNFKKYWKYSKNRELKKNFSVQKFLRHHEVLTRRDIERIKEISYIIGMEIGFKEGANVDSLRQEIFEQMELYIQSKPKPPQGAPINLESTFSDSQNLGNLVDLLIERKFVSREAGRLLWTGKPVEFAAMAKVCEPLIHKKYHSPKVLHEAWTNYFYHRSKAKIISDTYFKGTQKTNEVYFHQAKFEFIKRCFNIE